MESQLRALQKKAQQLELSGEDRQKLDEQIFNYAHTFLDDLPKKKAFVPSNGSTAQTSFSEEPTSLSAALEHFKTHVDAVGLNPASGNHLGYIPGGGLYPSALGDYLAAVTNRYAGVFFSSPGAVHIENQCIRWLCDLIGYGESAAGNLTSGGSIANLIGLVNARDNSGIKAQDYDKSVIYVTKQVHHCVIKAVKFAGLADAHLQIIPMDERLRMKTDALHQQIREDKEKGRIPLIIFASGGTTDVGAVDPLAEIGAIAGQEQIWFHVDAAYGGAFLLTEDGKQALKGIELADSVTIDPHKGLFLPYGSGAVLVKDAGKLYDSQQMSANYLQDAHKATAELSPADLSPELSKHFRGLRMWLPLMLFGVAPLRAALEEKLLLTRYFYQEAQQIEGMETGPEPDLSVLLFRYVPKEDDADAFNKKLVDSLHEDGRVFLSSTRIDGVFYLRLAVLSFRTHLDNIQQTIDIIKQKIAELS